MSSGFRERGALVLAAAIVFGSAAAADPGAASAAGLVGRERQIGYLVTSERAEGRDWIRMRADFETAYRASVEEAVAVIRDYEAGPRVFSRIESVRVRLNEGDRALIEQRTVVRVLGVCFETTMTFRITLERPCPGKAVVRFESVESDESMLRSEGSWSLEEAPGRDGPLTYLRYRADNWTAPRAPGQESAMRLFGAADMRMLLRELGEELKRRGKAEAGTREARPLG